MPTEEKLKPIVQDLAEDEDVVGSAATTQQNVADNVEFGDEDTMSKGDGFDKIAPPENDKSLVVRSALLSDILKPKKTWAHFVTNKGYFRCLTVRGPKGVIVKEGICCKKLNGDDKQKAQMLIGVLGLFYTNADKKTGKYLKKVREENGVKVEYVDPIEWAIGWHKLSQSGFRRVSNMIQEDASAHDFDLRTSWKDSGIGFEYNIIANAARFRQNPVLLAEVIEACEPFLDGKRLSQKLGKVITEIEWAALLGGTRSATSASKASINDVSDI